MAESTTGKGCVAHSGARTSMKYTLATLRVRGHSPPGYGLTRVNYRLSDMTVQRCLNWYVPTPASRLDGTAVFTDARRGLWTLGIVC